MKAISPLIGAIVLIGVSITVAAMVAPMVFRMASNPDQGKADKAIFCRNLGYDFDSSYWDYGIRHDFSGSSDWLEARISNTGTVNAYDFLFEFRIETPSGDVSKFFEPTEDTQRTLSSPLRPGRQATIKANITEDITGNLKEVRVLNRPCMDRYASALLPQI